MSTLITNAVIVNEGRQYNGSVLIREGRIHGIFADEIPVKDIDDCEIFDAQGKYLIPGVIDVHVHFREPGLCHKGNINSESRAAVAGGVTSFMDMPNTSPKTTTQELLAEKFELAAKKSFTNYSFYIGATNENFDELMKTDFSKTCGVKLFMGASTGNMLVNKSETLEKIFSQVPGLIAVHCEDEAIIRQNTELFRAKYGENVPIACHPAIRNAEACYRSTALAVELAQKYNARLHVLHLSTKDEIQLFRNDVALPQKRITAEVCIPHLCFSDDDYEKYGKLIKCNPAIKSAADKKRLFEALLDGTIDIVATDHAPHTIIEKIGTYFNSPSGSTAVQHSLPAMLEFVHNRQMTIEQVVEKMCHNPALSFKVKERGFIRNNYWADLALIDLSKEWTVTAENILYKCNWSPFEGRKFRSAVTQTWVNGDLIFNDGFFNEHTHGMALEFDRC